MDSLIRFRVSAADRDLFEAAARDRGLKLSEWLRTVARDAIKPAPGYDDSIKPPVAPERPTDKLFGSKNTKDEVVTALAKDKIAETRMKKPNVRRTTVPKPGWK